MRDDVVRCIARQLDVSERRRPDELNEPVRSHLHRTSGSLPGRFHVAQLRENEALEREVQPPEERLTRLCSRLLSLAGQQTGGSPGSRPSSRHRRAGREARVVVLVAVVVGPLHELDDRFARAFVRVGPGPALRERDQRLIHDAKVFSRVPKRQRPLCGRGRRATTEQRLRAESREDRVGCERVVAELRCQGQGDLRVLQRLLESLEDPDAAGGHAFVSDAERLAIVARLVEDLEKERLGLVGPFVQPDAREKHERPGAKPPRREGSEDVSKLRLRPSRVAGLEVEVGGVHRATHGIPRDAPGGSAAPPGRGAAQQGAARHAIARARRGLECCCDRLLRPVDRSGQLPGARLRVLKKVCESSVDLRASARIGGLVHPAASKGCVKRM